MASIKENINGLFAPSSSEGVSPEVMAELESIMRLYSTPPQELFYKWESYSLKMGAEDTKLDLKTVRMFRKDIQENLERAGNNGNGGRHSDRKLNIAATPRGATTNGDVFRMCVIAAMSNVAFLSIASDANVGSMNSLLTLYREFAEPLGQVRKGKQIMIPRLREKRADKKLVCLRVR